MTNNKITSITEVTNGVVLPDGIYIGKYGGYVISLTYNDKCYELKTEEGIRSIAVPVVVIIKSSIATFEMINN